MKLPLRVYFLFWAEPYVIIEKIHLRWVSTEGIYEKGKLFHRMTAVELGSFFYL